VCWAVFLYIPCVKYNPDLHHRRSIRLRGYDYASVGAYFVTIGCHNRINFFGEIENEKMIFNEYGDVARNEWEKLQERYSENKFDIFQIMPNHIHGIIETHRHNLAIGRIVGAYKSLVFTKCLEIAYLKKCHFDKLWQRNYWEYIIRNEAEYTRIAKYIRNNPILWGKKHLKGILPAN